MMIDANIYIAVFVTVIITIATLSSSSAEAQVINLQPSIQVRNMSTPSTTPLGDGIQFHYSAGNTPETFTFEVDVEQDDVVQFTLTVQDFAAKKLITKSFTLPTEPGQQQAINAKLRCEECAACTFKRYTFDHFAWEPTNFTIRARSIGPVAVPVRVRLLRATASLNAVNTDPSHIATAESAVWCGGIHYYYFDLIGNEGSDRKSVVLTVTAPHGQKLQSQGIVYLAHEYLPSPGHYDTKMRFQSLGIMSYSTQGPRIGLKLGKYKEGSSLAVGRYYIGVVSDVFQGEYCPGVFPAICGFSQCCNTSLEYQIKVEYADIGVSYAMTAIFPILMFGLVPGIAVLIVLFVQRRNIIAVRKLRSEQNNSKTNTPTVEMSNRAEPMPTDADGNPTTGDIESGATNHHNNHGVDDTVTGDDDDTKFAKNDMSRIQSMSSQQIQQLQYAPFADMNECDMNEAVRQRFATAPPIDEDDPQQPQQQQHQMEQMRAGISDAGHDPFTIIPSVMTNRPTLMARLMTIAAVLLLLPSFQFIWILSAAHRTDSTICYYNEQCKRPFLVFSYLSFEAMNNVLSNLCYIFLGINLYAYVYLRERSDLNHWSIQGQPMGVPTNYSVFYAVAIAIIGEGFGSAFYHICPTAITYAFDTTVMFFIAVLFTYSMSSKRDPSLLPRPSSMFLLMATVVAVNFFAVYVGFQTHSNRPQSITLMYWIPIGFFFLALLYRRLLMFVRKFAEFKASEKHREKQSSFCRNIAARWQSFQVALRIMYSEVQKRKLAGYWLISTLCLQAVFFFTAVIMNVDSSSYFLAHMVIYMLSFLSFYIVRKRTHSQEKVLWYVWVLAALQGITSITAIWTFTQAVTDKNKTLDESRLLNASCVAMFFDIHDIWHFLSGVALVLTAILMLHVDDDLANKPRKDIEMTM
jgi:dsRNA-gated channel SID-1